MSEPIETSTPCSTSASQPSSPVYFYRNRQRILASILDAALDIGRQREGEAAPVVRFDHSRGARVILAPIDDVEISRSHVELAPGDDGRVQVTNLSRTLPVNVDRESDNVKLSPGEATTAKPPVLIHFGNYAVRVEPPEPDDEELQLEGLPDRTLPPGRFAPADLPPAPSASLEEATLLRWLEAVLTVFQSAASARDFADQAARAAAAIVNLDAAAVLRCGGGANWQIDALHAAPGQGEPTVWTPSRTLLANVQRERRTFRSGQPKGAIPRSLQGVTALVAAPILNSRGDVIGALYGDRQGSGQGGRSPEISAFEAKLVELLASGIAAGIARLQEEQAAISARVRFEQFFTPQLAAQLERDPQLLEGRNAEVTLLFADIRGFSGVSERLGPARTMAWIQDAMGALSDCVLQCDGVLVDYLGDELMAMWGAPAAQSNHAELACLAARQMAATLPALNARWEGALGGPMRLGIGLNSGVARVGNTGSRHKFKYGPLGDVVNVASRAQGATKYLGADCLITGETLQELPPGAIVRRLARVRAVNIEHPIDLYELLTQTPVDWDERCARYNGALAALERDDLEQAARSAKELLQRFPHDAAAGALVERISANKGPELSGDTAVWQLPGK